MTTPERTGPLPLNRDVLLWALLRGLRSYLKVATAREIEHLQPAVERLRTQVSPSSDQHLREAIEALHQQIHQGGTGPQPYYADDLFDASLAATEAGDPLQAVCSGISA